MKRNEIALILVVVGLVVLTTYSLLNVMFGNAALKPVSVKSTDSISASINNPPDPMVFNTDAINPSVSVTIGNQSDQQPFNIKN